MRQPNHIHAMGVLPGKADETLCAKKLREVWREGDKSQNAPNASILLECGDVFCSECTQVLSSQKSRR